MATNNGKNQNKQTADKAADKPAPAEVEAKADEATREAIAKVVSDGGGLVKVTLGELRDEMGYHRLGKHVLTSMEQHLTENKLGYFPTDVLDPIINSEPRQYQELFVFVDDDSPKAEIFRAVADPEEHSLVEAIDHLVETIEPAEKPNYARWTAKRRLEEIERLAHAG